METSCQCIFFDLHNQNGRTIDLNFCYYTINLILKKGAPQLRNASYYLQRILLPQDLPRLNIQGFHRIGKAFQDN